MATFEAHIEGLTQIDITATSAPNQTELTDFLQEALVDVVNKMIQFKPKEAFKFAAESEAANDNGITVTGSVLSVVREHDSVTILRPCTPMPSELKYESTDINSLHYRSKYNPGYFVSNGKIFVRPAAAGSDNDVKVSQISYDIGGSGLAFGDNYNQGAVENFPTEYEYLIAIYAGAKSCHAAASDIQNNMPTKPTAVISPNFLDDDVDLPTEPIFIQPNLDIGGLLSKIQTAISREDFDLVDKEISLFDKTMEKYEKNFEAESTIYAKELEIFKADLDRVTKNKDRSLQKKANEYKSELDKYVAEDAQYKSQIQEKLTKYKWFVEQHHILLSQYNSAFGISKQQAPQKKQKQERSRGEE